MSRLDEYETRLKVLLEYQRTGPITNDQHAIRDASFDIESLQARIDGYKEGFAAARKNVTSD